MKRVFAGLLTLTILVLFSFPGMAAEGEPPKVGPDVGNLIKPFTAKSPIDGKEYDQKSVTEKGKDTALLFMQTACSLCVAELREFINVKDEVEGKLNVFVVSVDINPDRVANYMKNLGSTFPALHDKDAMILSSLGFSSTPSLVILASNGQIKDKSVGFDVAKVKTLLKSYK